MEDQAERRNLAAAVTVTGWRKAGAALVPSTQSLGDSRDTGSCIWGSSEMGGEGILKRDPGFLFKNDKV